MMSVLPFREDACGILFFITIIFAPRNINAAVRTFPYIPILTDYRKSDQNFRW